MRRMSRPGDGIGSTMNVTILALALVLAGAPFAAAAGEPEGKALRLEPKEAMLGSAPSMRAPFVIPDGDPVDLDFVPHPESRRGAPSSCDGDSSLCYDPTNGHLVYKPARDFMPDIPGLQRENISVKRDRIVFRYSF
jgi:hypothetical protein